RSRRVLAPIGSEGPIGKLLIRGEYGHDIIDELTPMTGEPIVDKPGYGAFYQTDLEIILRSRGIHQLILTGVTTEVCIQSTLREAIDRGFDCITLSDGCASPYPELHAASMSMIWVEGGVFGVTKTTAELLQIFEHSALAEAPR
ncbi:MAG: cysteine hydrolase, partial [Gammaproteobacteria bacterium]